MTGSPYRTGTAIGLLALFAAALVALAAGPHIWTHALEQDERDALRHLATAQRRVAAIAPPDARPEASPAAIAAEAGLLPGDTNGIAAAELEALLAGIVARHGGTMDVSRVIPVKQTGTLTRIGITATVRTAIGGLANMLHELESEQRFLLVERLAVDAPSSRPNARPKTELRVELQIAGFVRRDETPTGTGAE